MILFSFGNDDTNVSKGPAALLKMGQIGSSTTLISNKLYNIMSYKSMMIPMPLEPKIQQLTVRS
jgi:hypothetical protein